MAVLSMLVNPQGDRLARRAGGGGGVRVERGMEKVSWFGVGI